MTSTTKGLSTLEPEETIRSLDGAAVELLSRGAPDWLYRRRQHAWSVYEDTPLPSTRSEEWRYTDLSRIIDLESLRLLTPDHTDPDAPEPDLLTEAMIEDWAASGHSVLVDGRTVHVDLDPDLGRQGVILTSLRSAVRDHPELLEEHLAVAALPKLAALLRDFLMHEPVTPNTARGLAEFLRILETERPLPTPF